MISFLPNAAPSPVIGASIAVSAGIGIDATAFALALAGVVAPAAGCGEIEVGEKVPGVGQEAAGDGKSLPVGQLLADGGVAAIRLPPMDAAPRDAAPKNIPAPRAKPPVASPALRRQTMIDDPSTDPTGCIMHAPGWAEAMPSGADEFLPSAHPAIEVASPLQPTITPKARPCSTVLPSRATSHALEPGSTRSSAEIQNAAPVPVILANMPPASSGTAAPDEAQTSRDELARTGTIEILPSPTFSVEPAARPGHVVAEPPRPVALATTGLRSAPLLTVPSIDRPTAPNLLIEAASAERKSSPRADGPTLPATPTLIDLLTAATAPAQTVAKAVVDEPSALPAVSTKSVPSSEPKLDATATVTSERHGRDVLTLAATSSLTPVPASAIAAPTPTAGPVNPHMEPTPSVPATADPSPALAAVPPPPSAIVPAVAREVVAPAFHLPFRPLDGSDQATPSSDAKPVKRGALPATPPSVITILPRPVPAVTSGPAAQVFAGDLRRAVRNERAPAFADIAGPLAGSEGVGVSAAPALAAAMAAPLDLRDPRWPGAMVDRIERMRDAADAADTRIRLVPDALGSIDVSVRRDGETVHVHLAAEQAATRALIHDAAPRLAEAAEARGIKLGQVNVDGGAAGQNGGQPNRPPPTAPLPTSPAPSRADDEDRTDFRTA